MTHIEKFGGSSQCLDGYTTIISRVKEALSRDSKTVFVLSAIQNTTNNLYNLLETGDNKYYDDIVQSHLYLCEDDPVVYKLQELKNMIDSFSTVQDRINIISMGEKLATTVFIEIIKDYTDDVCEIDATEMIHALEESKDIDPVTLKLTTKYMFNPDFDLDECDEKIIVTQGFVAQTSDGKKCLLTRSGSDTTASIIAAGNDAELLTIWTDVSGIFTTDPRVCKSAYSMSEISYDMCQELSAMGAGVIHPYALKPCQEKNIPIHIRNTFDPEGSFTAIKHDPKDKNHVAIAVQKNVTVYNIESRDMWNDYGFVHDIFGVFAKNGINVNIITTSQFSITTTTDETDNSKLVNAWRELKVKYDVEIVENCCIVSVISNNYTTIGTDAEKVVFDTYSEFLHIVHFSSNKLSVSFVVDFEKHMDIVNDLHFIF